LQIILLLAISVSLALVAPLVLRASVVGIAERQQASKEDGKCTPTVDAGTQSP
jgi:hypothetical protein